MYEIIKIYDEARTAGHRCDIIIIYIHTFVHVHTQIINQVVLWDKIIKRGEPATISAAGIKSKYPFFDDGFGLM